MCYDLRQGSQVFHLVGNLFVWPPDLVVDGFAKAHDAQVCHRASYIPTADLSPTLLVRGHGLVLQV